jgi:hypothetical protein
MMMNLVFEREKKKHEEIFVFEMNSNEKLFMLLG